MPAVSDVGGAFGNVFATTGVGWLPVSAFIDVPGTPPSWVRGYQLTVELDSRSPDAIEGRLGIGLPSDRVADAIVPAIVRHAAVLLEGQPGCPLACEDEALARMVRIFDENEDGVIAEAEVRDDSLFDLVMRPDVDLLADWNGMQTWWPGHDREPDSLSLGFGFHAVRAELSTE